jgi:4,5-DOPA dioxygenase extradiol
MPVVFFGHGSPMNTLERNKYTETWRALGESIPRPKAILCVSAHWYTEGTAVTAMEKPKTIHDFYGFPQALFDVQYPAPGDPRLAARVRELLEPVEVRLDDSWGLDHGTWSVLKHAYPDAKIPVVQLSIDGTRAPEFHYETGRRLAPLRDEGVLVAGSGNVVHNLRLMRRAGGPAFDWAVRFNERVREALASRDHQALIEFERLGAALHRRAAERGRADVLRRGRLRDGLARHAHSGYGNAREVARRPSGFARRAARA